MNDTLQARDWAAVHRGFLQATPFRHVVLDDLIVPGALTRIQHELEAHDHWEEILGTNLRWNRPRGPEVERLAIALAGALKPIVNTLRITSHWVIAGATGAGIPMHADNATVSINIWLSPTEANEDPSTGGMLFYDVNRPDHMDYATFSSHDACARYVEEHGGAVSLRVPYRCNRAVLFDARAMHRSEEVRFSGTRGLLYRRLNLTYSWDRIEWARERAGIESPVGLSEGAMP